MNEEEREDDTIAESATVHDEPRQKNGSLESSRSNLSSDILSLVQNIAHDVTFTVTVAIAVPTEPDEQSQLKDALLKQMIETPRAQNYYHLEYNLLPEDELLKTDVVTFGVACKIFMDKHEARVIKTWQTGDTTWFAWSYSHTVNVTKELLLKMFEHTVELRLWNTKDKCSTRARFDRPKAFRFQQFRPGEKPEEIGGVKTMVATLLERYISMQPKRGTMTRPLLKELSKDADNTDVKVQPASPAKDGKAGRLHKLSEAEKFEQKSKKDLVAKTKSEKIKPGGKEDKDVKKQISDHSKLVAEQIKKFGICMIPLRLALFYSNQTTVISRLENPASGVEDIFLDISINSPLLSRTQEEDLNPMKIQICNASDLPDSPIPYSSLKLKCNPVYCKYKFFKEPEHVTPGREHCKNIYWEDTNIFLLGMMESSQLKEYLSGPGMEIEVHDRDRKPDQVTMKPTLFGDDLEDEKISNVGTVESRRTLHNPFHGRDKPWDPFGVAKVDLSELLLGVSFLELKIPIMNCPIPDILGTVPSVTGKLVGVAGAVDGPVDQPFSAGHYVQSSSILKVRIQLAHPLTAPSKLLTKEYIAPSMECPFHRIIFIFDYHNTELLHNLQTLVMGFNARALGLDSMPQHVIDSALSTYKLSIVQQCSLDLDIVTGFHVLDGVQHIFILEGLGDKAISVLWEALPQPEDSDVRVLYNSDLSFSKRLYGPLDVDLCRVKLHEPLSVIVQQPLLYIRDMVFRPCFDALVRLDQITKMDKMRNIVRNDLFPTAEMVVSLSREFGVPFTQKDFEELQPSASEEIMEQEVPEMEPSKSESGRKLGTHLDNYNFTYEEHLMKNREAKNYIGMNIKDVHAKSDAVHAENEKNKKGYFTVDTDPVYNYSIQYLNTSELSKDYLRHYLREQDPKALYAYNQEFMSGMFCPVNIEQEKKNMEAVSRARWRTEKGWTSSLKKSTLECHAHPAQPDPSRLEELREEWLENVLHGNIIKPPLDRDHYPWCDRKKDFELYTRPCPDFGSKMPLSLRVSGVEQDDDQKAAKLKLFEDWQSRLVTDVRQHFHRVLPATEMMVRGFYSSNQIDRLKGLLKDPIRKYGLALGSDVNDISPLAMANGQCRDASACCNGSPCKHSACQPAKLSGLKPGDFSHSWTHNDNHIPCHNYEHEKFKQLKGHDFSANHRSRNKLSHRPILALRPEERDNNLFRIPFSARPYSRPLPPVTSRRPLNSANFLNITNHSHMSDGLHDMTAGCVKPVKDADQIKSQEMSEPENETGSQGNPQAIKPPNQEHIPVMV